MTKGEEQPFEKDVEKTRRKEEEESFWRGDHELHQHKEKK